MGNPNIYYCSADGDNIGNIIGRSFLNNDLDQIKATAKKIELGGHIMRVFVLKHRGDVINIGGDEGVWAIPESAIPDLERLRQDYNQATGFTLSVGVGKLPSESATSLLAAKIRGKNQVVFFDQSIKKEIKRAKLRVKQRRASIAEQKLAEAGLLKAENQNPTEQDCEYCKQTDGVDPDHCKHCHDQDEECPYCQEAGVSDHDENCPLCEDEGVDEHGDDCPMCQESASAETNNEEGVQATAGPQVQLPTTTSSQDYAGQDLLSPDIDKPDAISENPDGLAFNPDVQTNNNRRLDEEGNEESGQEAMPQSPQDGESVQGVLDEIDSLPPTESQARQETETIDAPDLAVGTNMEGNTSRPEGFESDVPGDMGLGSDGGENIPHDDSSPDYEQHPENAGSETGAAQGEGSPDYEQHPENQAEGGEGSPDISSVLQEGLDSHADSIQREKTIQLVAEALEGFKASKDILEKAKIQAPQLYESSIAMLKAMIEMAKMLGLENEAEQQAGGQMEDQSGAPDYESHPENAAAQEDAAPADPKAKGQSGNQ